MGACDHHHQVEDVQELVRKAQLSSSSSSPASSVVIPERFVKGGTAPGADTRPTVVVPAAYSSSSSSSSSCGGDDHHEEEEQQQQEEYTIKIPVIDLSKLLITSSVDGVNSPLFLDELSNLSHACQHWGFFQVVNHGVEKGLLEKMERLAMEFFMQPVEEKRKYAMAPGGIQGYGQAFVFSQDQKLDWCNMFALGVHPHSIRLPSLWPSNPPHFRETVETYTREMRGLCEKLMKYIGITLNGNDDVFDRAFAKGCVQAVRMNYYPPCPRPDLVLGLSPHSDGSALTVLQQPNFGPPGLQILNDKNEWVQVPSLPNALVINVGDTIEVLTNGKYKSVEHRAVTDKERDRLSIVTFYAPSYEMEIGPLPEMVTEDNPAQFRTYNHGEFSKHYVTSKLQGKKSLDFAKFSF